MKSSKCSILSLVSKCHLALLAGACSAVPFSGCAHYEDHTQRDKVSAVMEIDSIPQGAEVYISRVLSDAVPGEPGGDWVAKGAFGFVGRTPLKVDDEIIRSKKSTRKTMTGGVVVYDATGVPVYEENLRRVVLLKPGFKAIDVTQPIGIETQLRLQLVRNDSTKKDGDQGDGEKGTRAPEAQSGTQGKLSIVSVPTPADVEIDGRYVGETPAAVQLPPGSHQILVHRKGQADWKRTIELFPGSDQKVTATLEGAVGDKPDAGGK